jgi:hypothetical protein
MAKDYDNNMSGALFGNDQKQSDKEPDYKGSAEVDGVQYWISGWVNKSKDGKKYLKIKFTAKDSNGGRSGGRQSGGAQRGGNRNQGGADDFI